MLNLSLTSELISNDEIYDYLLNMHIELRACGSWKRNSTTSTGSFVVSEFEITYIRSGLIKVTTPHGEHICGDNTLILFEPFVEYSVEKLCSHDLNMDMYNIFFELYPQYRHAEFVSRLIDVYRPYYLLEDFPSFGQMFYDIFEENKALSDGKKMIVESLLKSLLSYMIVKRREDGMRDEFNYTPIYKDSCTIVKKAIKIVEKNLSVPISIDHICNQLSISKSYLNKSFNSVTNISPQQYFLQMKLKKAQQYIKFEGKSITQCAIELGFSSPYHLSNSYKKIFGVSPSKHL